MVRDQAGRIDPIPSGALVGPSAVVVDNFLALEWGAGLERPLFWRAYYGHTRNGLRGGNKTLASKRTLWTTRLDRPRRLLCPLRMSSVALIPH
jgi:hypothetical protein